MQQVPHTVIFSHGFGVTKDDRGLYTDIATMLRGEGLETVLFDYNIIDTVKRELIVQPLSVQKDILFRVIAETREKQPDGIIDLVCHSMGCVIAGLADVQGVRKIVFLAPPFSLGYERMLARFLARPGTQVNPIGTSRLVRHDGSVTVVHKEFLDETATIQPLPLYQSLARATELMVITANQDEVLEPADGSALASDAHFIALDANHNFQHEARERVMQNVRDILCDR